jgi:PPOX class probable F420-dependent enzyme
MWFAAVKNTLFLRTEARSANMRRINRRPIVKVAACTMRGKPLDDHIECRARVAPREREAHAEAALGRRYGLLRRLVNVFTHNDCVYIELTPLDPRGLSRPDDSAPRSGVRAVRDGRIEPEKPPPDAA